MREEGLRRPRSLDVANCYPINQDYNFSSSSLHQLQDQISMKMNRPVAVVFVDVISHQKQAESSSRRRRRSNISCNSLRPYTWGPNERRFVEQLRFSSIAFEDEQDYVLGEEEVIPSPVIMKKFLQKTSRSQRKMSSQKLPASTKCEKKLKMKRSKGDWCTKKLNQSPKKILINEDAEEIQEIIHKILEAVSKDSENITNARNIVEDKRIFSDTPDVVCLKPQSLPKTSTDIEIESVVAEAICELLLKVENAEERSTNGVEHLTKRKGEEKDQGAFLSEEKTGSLQSNEAKYLQDHVSSNDNQKLDEEVSSSYLDLSLTYESDLFSEEHEAALEEAKGFHGQDTIVHNRITTKDFKQFHLNKTSSLVPTSNNMSLSLRDIILEKCKLEKVVELDNEVYQKSFKSSSVPEFLIEEDLIISPCDYNNFICKSEVSNRLSTASSETIVASGGEDSIRLELLGDQSNSNKHSNSTKKYHSSSSTKANFKFNRSRSWESFRRTLTKSLNPHRRRLVTTPNESLIESSSHFTTCLDQSVVGKLPKKNRSNRLKRSLRTRSFASLLVPGKHFISGPGVNSGTSSLSSSSSTFSPPASPRFYRSGNAKTLNLEKEDKNLSERQADEACRWLRSAGFPQYVHLYEGGSFSLNAKDVNLDHDFLNDEQIAAIVRRLNILNKCASMKLDRLNQHTFKNLVASSSNVNESDEDEEEYAISDVWKFDPVNDIGRWSRLNSVATSTIDEENISSSISDVASHSAGEDVFMVQKSSHSTTKNAKNFDDEIRSKKSSDKKSKIPFNKSQSFLKKVGSDLKKLRGGSFRKKEGLKKLVISDPVLTCGQDRVNQMNCLSIEARSHPVRKNSSQSLISSSSSGGEEASCSGVGNSSRYFCGGQSEQSFILLSSFPTSHLSASKVKLVADNVFLTPSDHVPGTFPITIRDPDEEPITQTSQSIGSISSSSSSPLTGSQSSCDIIESMKHRSIDRPTSFYDNLPDDDGATAQELLDLLQSPASHLIKRTDNSEQTAFTSEEFSSQEHKLNIDGQFLWNYDEIVNASNNLQNMVKNWEQDLQVSTNKTNDQNISSSFLLPTTNYKKTLPSYIDVNKVNSKQDGNLKSNKGDDTTKGRSLFSWQNFSCNLKRQISTTEKSASNIRPVSLVYIHELSAGQLMMLRRLSLLKLTALMESYAPSNNKNAGWSLPRFIRKVKIPDYKDKRVFGVPLIENVRESGKALPPCILQALIYLRQTSLTLKGIFRKPGVKSRITKLRCCCESTGRFNLYDDCSAYDVADMVKQYFRELPDSLMTSKLNDTFVGIFLHVPENLRLQTLQAAVMLLPDENREALMTLLCFLNCVASNSSENQMTSSNLATCFAPSLFCFQSRSSQTSVSPKSRKAPGSKSGSQHLSGRLEQREKDENLIANKCILFMIDNVHLLFMLPEDTMTQCRISVMQQVDDVLGTEIGFSTPEVIGCETTNQAGFLHEFHSYVDRIVSQGPRDEHRTLQGRNAGWHNNTTINGCEVMCKKINDGNPLRLWRCKIDGVKAPVKRVLERILHERQTWDKDLCEWKVIQQPDKKTQLFQIVSSEMPPHPTRDFCVLRSWRTDVTPQGGAAVVEISAGQNISMIGDVRGVMLTSRYFIEPSTNSLDECSITRICRVDMKGRNPEWYNKTYGHRVCLDLLRIRSSFTSENLP